MGSPNFQIIAVGLRLADRAAPLESSVALRFIFPAFPQLFKEPQQHQPLLLGEDGRGLFDGGTRVPKSLGDERAAFRREIHQAHASPSVRAPAWSNPAPQASSGH
jgi:hypothetical protein